MSEYDFGNAMKMDQTDPETMDAAANALREALGTGPDGRF